MKFYLNESTDKKEIDPEILWQARCHAVRFRGATVDIDNHEIVIPLDKGATEEELFNEYGLGTWFKDNGFDVSLDRRDVTYTTKGDWINYRAITRSKGHNATLRDRLVLTVTW